MPDEKPSEQNAEVRYPIGYSTLAYGIGMALGFLLIYLIFISPIISWIVGLIDPLQVPIKIVIGLFLYLGTIGLGGAVAGAWGGLAISRFSEATTQRHFVWRGALSFFITHLLLALPTIALVALTSFFNQDIDVSWTKLPRLMLLIGLLYGLVGGLLFGLLTAGLRRFLWVVLAAVGGFGLGGFLLGLVIRGAADWQSGWLRLLAVLVAFFLFGATGGAALGFVYKRYQDEKDFLPDSTLWKALRVGLAIFLALVAGFAIYNVYDLIKVVRPPLAEQLSLPTVSTAWLPEQAGVPGTAVAATTGDVVCENNVLVMPEGGQMVPKPEWAPCYETPLVAVDKDGVKHAIWYTDEVQRIVGPPFSSHYLVESVETAAGWSFPAILAETAGSVTPQLSSDEETLFLSWEDGSGVQTLSMTPYHCQGPPAGDIAQAVYETVRQERFRPASDPVTYCQNRFDRLHFTPNPKAPQQPFEQRELGAFDTVADVVRDAQYEVLFVTMQWDAPSDVESPGDSLTQAIADLYEQVKANPEQYPRGMTVRIMLGNLPEPAVFRFADQMHYVIVDLRKAGIERGEDPEIGWHLEVANYLGNLPHAHSKFLVVDGKTAVAAGFNYSYLHLEKDYPSDLALGMTDMGLQMTGPIAQTVMAAYDDLWLNSESLTCIGRPPFSPMLFSLLCGSRPSEVSHVPEVLRFYPAEPETGSSAFALHHTYRHLESDEALLAAIGAAQEAIDLFEVNFSLNTPCLVLAQISDLCTSEDFATEYMIALRDAVLNNDVKLRVMMEESAMNGLENRAGIRWLTGQLEGTGKEDNIDLRFSGNKMHNKGVLIDKEFLSVGSQNFHFSAWGSPSLTEYNIATDDPRAVEEFLTEYEYWWDLAVPVEDIMGQQDILAKLNSQ